MRLIDVDAFKREHRMADMCGDCDRTIRECEYDSGLSLMDFCDWLDDAPTIEKQEWTPCSERLPDDIKPVIVTWKNTDPKSYYQYIVGKHYTGVACYKSGRWYWYSSTTEDILAEYGRYDLEEFDEAIECIAWMQLPSPYSDTTPKEGEDV